jgi:glycerophosphoryl diester phosphodiesterase
MTEAPVALRHAGRRTLLKWHRGRETLTDPAFCLRVLARGLSAGASVEIDLQPLADGGFAVIHDALLDRETTGTGPVCGIDRPGFLALFRRDEALRVLPEPALTLDVLSTRLGGIVASGAVLQLDLQCGDDDLTPRHVEGFAAALGPLSAQAILSGEDAAAVRRLAAAAPGLAVGYDPCGETGQIGLARAGSWPEFVQESLAAMPQARTIYLALELPFLAADQGFDLIGAFQRGGRLVDCFTLQGDEPDAADLARRLVTLGADQITTDDPAGLAGVGRAT